MGLLKEGEVEIEMEMMKVEFQGNRSEGICTIATDLAKGLEVKRKDSTNAESQITLCRNVRRRCA